MVCLVCSLAFGVFGFSPAPLTSGILTKGLFFVFFTLAMVALACGTVAPRAAWRTLDYHKFH